MSNSIKITIKPQYHGRNLNYTVGIEENLDLYVLLAKDEDGYVMGKPGETTRENPATAVFALSKEEFDLKDTDEDKLDDLAFELMHSLPRDRIIAEQNLRSNNRVDTIDGGKLLAQRRAQLKERDEKTKAQREGRAKEGIQTILKQGTVWYHSVQDTAGGAPYLIPADNQNAAVVLFTKEEYAKQAADSLKTLPLEVRKLEGAAINGFFSSLLRIGATRIIVDLGLPSSGDADRDVALSIQNERLKGHRMINSRLSAAILGHVQSKKLTTENADKITAAFWQQMCREFPKSLFFIPVAIAGKEAPEDGDKDFLVSPSAAAVIKEVQPSLDGMNGYKTVGLNGQTVNFITFNSADKRFFPIFTNMPELRASFHDKCHVALISYQDLMKQYAGFDGVVVNAATLNLTITAAGMENMVKRNSESEEK